MAIVASVLILAGLIFLIVGQRIFKRLLQFAAFLIVGLIVGMLVYQATSPSSDLAWLWGSLAGLGAGIGAAILVLCVYIIGIFFLGVAGGFSLASLIIIAIGAPVLKLKWLVWTWVAVFGLTGGILSLVFRKALLIFMTSIFGAYSVVLGIDYFAEPTRHYLFPSTLYTYLRNHPDPADQMLSTTTYVLLGVYVVLIIFGCLIQQLTKKKDNKDGDEKVRLVQYESTPQRYYVDGSHV